jgi:predicted nucleic acid-binding protein
VIYLLDTNTLIDLIKKKPPHVADRRPALGELG